MENDLRRWMRLVTKVNENSDSERKSTVDNTEDKIVDEAVEAVDQELLNLVVRLDGLLTARPDEAQKNAKQRSYMFVDATTFLMDVIPNTYYLADGGYSRLLIDDEKGVKAVDSISRDDVKRRWRTPEVQEAVVLLNQHLMAATQN